MIGVEQWAEIRRMHVLAGLSITESGARTRGDRNTFAGRCARASLAATSVVRAVEARPVRGGDPARALRRSTLPAGAYGS